MSDSTPDIRNGDASGNLEDARNGDVPDQTVDDGKGRIFPCTQCGADLVFHIGQQSLSCPYCGHDEALEFEEDEDVEEQDFRAMLERMAELRGKKADSLENTKEVRCESCGSTVSFQGSLTSSECAFCGSPIQREKVHDAPDRVPVDGVLPIRVNESQVRKNLAKWVKSRWFAPNEFKRRGVRGDFRGVYLPFWTFDSQTFTRYTGERGEYYYVTVGSGDNKRTERRTRWYPASGSFTKFFDDVLVNGTRGLPAKVLEKLEPWPLQQLVPFNQQLLAGFLAQTYDVELEPAFRDARTRIDKAIHSAVCSHIGGDTQRVHSVRSKYDPITYKHLLLPVWLLAYKYKGKSYQVAVNAMTGEVQGERPYSWIKITLAAIFGVAAGVAGAAAAGVFQ